ncbi:MAG: DUF190 domain-containing protein [Betaproteobacteria bacterium]|nr:DUF190 domain-containing protein [Betaproteobacteria bacterium]
MQGVYLKFFVLESQKHGGKLLYEWLLEEAQRIGIAGGSVFRAIAGYGRHGVIHEETFFELAGDLPMEVVFAAKPEQTNALIERLKNENLHLVYLQIPAELGVLGEAPRSA